MDDPPFRKGSLLAIEGLGEKARRELRILKGGYGKSLDTQELETSVEGVFSGESFEWPAFAEWREYFIETGDRPGWWDEDIFEDGYEFPGAKSEVPRYLLAEIAGLFAHTMIAEEQHQETLADYKSTGRKYVQILHAQPPVGYDKTCVALEGKTFPVGDLMADLPHFPGCRCTTISVSAPDRSRGSEPNDNRGESELVAEVNHEVRDEPSTWQGNLPDSIDEEGIRNLVYGREQVIAIDASWETPAGNTRSAPMFFVDLENEYLGLTKRVQSKDSGEVEQKAKAQIEQWIEKEIKGRISEAKQDMKRHAKRATEHLKSRFREIECVLESSLQLDPRISWETLASKDAYPPFVEDQQMRSARPGSPALPLRPVKPAKGILGFIIPSIRKRALQGYECEVEAREVRCRELEDHFQVELREWESERSAALAVHQEKEAQFLREQEAMSAQVEQLRVDFEAGESEAIAQYMEHVHSSSQYPPGLEVECKATFEAESGTLVVDATIPSLDKVPIAKEFKFVATRGTIETVNHKAKDTEAIYDDFVRKVALKIVHEAFGGLYTDHVAAVVCNLWATSLDPSTGHDSTSCVLSLMAERAEFERINLARADPAKCLAGLKTLVAGPLSQMAPVAPIMVLNRDDNRFVESQAVLAEINSTTNLAEIPWEDFEHLVRELFASLFSGANTEVRVTQASRDAGVDAIAFDPDPIRGGKFVIQAKRYTKVVGVSAARDLYGTMINEGASKGILVTTSHFGPDTREFVKDKPLTLIDGPNLVHLLEEQGHKVRIDIEAARRKLGNQV